MYKLIFTESYQKRAKKFFKKHPELLDRYKKVLFILQSNPEHPSLRLHKLSGKIRDFYSVSINLKYRVILDFVIESNIVILLDIGKHDDVYL